MRHFDAKRCEVWIDYVQLKCFSSEHDAEIVRLNIVANQERPKLTVLRGRRVIDGKSLAWR